SRRRASPTPCWCPDGRAALPAPRMRIVDDDVSWNSIAAVQEKEEEEEDESDMPVVAEFIDERPDEVKLMEEFRTNTKWKLLGGETRPFHPLSLNRHDTPDSSPPKRLRHDSLDKSPPGQQRHDSPDLSPPRQERNNSSNHLPPRRQRHDSPDLSPPRRKHHDSPDLSPPRRQRHDSPDLSPPRRKHNGFPDLSPPRRKRHDSPDLSPKRVSSAMGKKGCKTTDKSQSGGVQGEQSQLRRGVSDKTLAHQKHQTTPDLSPPRKKRYDSDSDLSPPRRRKAGSPSLKKEGRTKGECRYLRRDSDSPSPRRSTRNTSDVDCRLGRVRSDSPKRGPLKQNRSKSSDSDLSPPRRTLPAEKDQHGSRNPPDLSPHYHRDTKGSPKKVNESRHSQTVFRDKFGRRRDLAQEWLEQQQKAEAKSEREEQYAKWGKGLAQERQQQQNVEDAIKEMQKPLARYIDDQDLDRMLREQEREGDPMADFIKKRKAKENKEKKEKPRYNGPAPPLNRFNIWPGHRWDGVDRSNGFEQQRFARIANKKAVQEVAYKWSVEDM
uniref:BUD13 homolog n=1 Tax=Falco tinnunculus TaxID=100819 RepID=A0A8C4U2L2_FALTI